jgi:hypothetical protein
VTLNRIAGGPVRFILTHNQNYRGHPDRRPEIEVDIATVTSSNVLRGTVRTSVLVDSGADFTLLDAANAAPLGIDLARCPSDTLFGLGGSPFQVRASQVLMYLCGRWINVRVYFGSGQHTQLLGRQDAFDKLLIAFFHPSYDLYASPI